MLISGSVRAVDDLPSSAKHVVAQLAEGDFDAVVARFDGNIREAVSLETLKTTWNTILEQVGPFQEQAAVNQQVAQGLSIIVVTCKFEKAWFEIRLAFNTAGEITKFSIRPGQDPSLPYTAPSYVKPETFHEVDVMVGEGEWTLPGTLSLPLGAGSFPAVVLVHGTGPHDRDESLGPNKPFRDLAGGLVSQGIAVLRYDKRTRVYPGCAAIPHFTVKEETIDDALAAVKMLRARPEIDTKRILVLGHSHGAMLAPRIGNADPQIAGLILMAAPAQPLEDAILRQMTYLMALKDSLSAADTQQLAEIKTLVEAIKAADLVPDTPAAKLFGAPGSYWLDLRGYQPAQAARDLPKPLLIMQGEREYQVTMDDLKTFSNVLRERKDVTIISYPTLNHLFIAGTGVCTPDEYRKPGHVAAQVVTDITAWIKGLK